MGDFGYEARADLDGSAFVNSNDSQYVRDQQNAIIYRSSGRAALQNPNNKRDVNNDGNISPLDVLIVINALNQRGEGEEPTSLQSYYLDVTGDELLDPLDALTVINWLNGDTSGDVPFETGEGESTWIEEANDQALHARTYGTDSLWADYASTPLHEQASQLSANSNYSPSAFPAVPNRLRSISIALEDSISQEGWNADPCFAQELDVANEGDLAETLQLLPRDVFAIRTKFSKLK